MTVCVERNAVVDLETLVQQVPQWARECGMVPLARTPGLTGRSVGLGPDDLGAEEFVGLAREGGARFLYYVAERFEAEDFAVLDDGDEEDSPEDRLDADSLKTLRALRRRAKTHDGELDSVALCFVTDGVAHYWAAEAPWRAKLDEQWTEFSNALSYGAQVKAEEMRAHIEQESARPSKELEAHPDMRSARGMWAFAIASEVYPAPDGADDETLYAHRRILQGALRDAEAAIGQTAFRLFTRYEQELDTLATEILDQQLLNGATTAAVRRIRVQDFLTEKSGGYAPPKRTVDLLLARPELKAPKPRPGGWPDGQLHFG
ncbi:hypothetical protein [Streptomyces violascens]|uniref:hypothetical protein n=1 Tax=Streptomyces violascens TaxID=67381 RepID=UPI0016759BCC|nr:hypothetical protein [Streptomyces violascens]GGU42817.1 hypothetical protein GCM10010289_74460 [Streptomyces violascens]